MNKQCLPEKIAACILMSCLSLSREDTFAHQERDEDEHEANGETHREQLPIEQDAEHHAEHRLKTQDERGLRGLDAAQALYSARRTRRWSRIAPRMQAHLL